MIYKHPQLLELQELILVMGHLSQQHQVLMELMEQDLQVAVIILQQELLHSHLMMVWDLLLLI